MLVASKHMGTADYPESPENANAAMRTLPSASIADVEHLRNHDSKVDGERSGIMREMDDLRKTKNDIALRRGFTARDVERNGEPTREDRDPKTGDVIRTVRVNWQKPFDLETAECNARLATLEARLKEIPRSIMPTVLEFFTQYYRVNFVRVAPLDVDEPGVAPLEILEHKRAVTDLANSEFERVEGARRTVAECLARAERDIARRVKLGAPRYGLLFQGGSYDRSGVFSHRNPKAAIQFPMTRSLESEGFDLAIIPDAINFDFWRDHVCDGGKMAKVILNGIREHGDDSTAISERDKPARLKATAAAILAAQREEEAALRLCEANGISVMRRMDQCPVTALLNIERESGATIAPEANDADHATGADPEFG